MKIEFKLIPKSQIKVILPLLAELDPTILQTILASRLEEMLYKGYECVGIYCKHELIGICGLWILVKYYVGKHLEPDNVYIKPEFQNQGLGHWLQNYARKKGCEAIELNYYIQNEKGRKYWESNTYKTLGIHYQKKI